MKDIKNLTDEEVAEMVRKKDKEAYAEIIHRYKERLMRYAVNIIGDEHMASDIVQEAFIKAYINLNGFDIKKKFSSWIYRIVHNQAVNVIKKDRKQVYLNDNYDFDSGISLEEDLIKKELAQKTQSCLQRMSLKYREPISLFYLEEKSYEEISDILRIPVNTVGTRIKRGKIMMKEICKN